VDHARPLKLSRGSRLLGRIGIDAHREYLVPDPRAIKRETAFEWTYRAARADFRGGRLLGFQVNDPGIGDASNVPSNRRVYRSSHVGKDLKANREMIAQPHAGKEESVRAVDSLRVRGCIGIDCIIDADIAPDLGQGQRRVECQIVSEPQLIAQRIDPVIRTRVVGELSLDLGPGLLLVPTPSRMRGRGAHR